MNTRNVILALVALAGVVGIGWSLRGPADSRIVRSFFPGDSFVVAGVESLMDHPNRFLGKTIRVDGVVGRVVAERHLFSLADVSDREELLNGGVTRCVTLPVRWFGPMPGFLDEVTVQGRVDKSEGKFVFVAERVDRTKAHASERGAQ